MSKLGKGLQSLIPQKQKSADVEYPKLSQPLRDRKESVFNIDIKNIRTNPYQPRHEMDLESLKDLSESIKQHGILQPLIVTKVVRDTSRGQDVDYQVVAGHRRLEAARIAGLPFVPAIVRDSTDQQKLELALVENIQRSDLNPIERALGFKRLQEEFDLTHDEIAKKVGKSREFVSNSLRLLNLPDSVQDSLRTSRISEGHARAMAGIKNPSAQKALLDEILANSLSVRQVEQRVREVYVASHKRKVVFDPEIKKIAQKLEMYLGKKVNLKKSGVGMRLQLDFEDKNDLESIVRKIVQEGL